MHLRIKVQYEYAFRMRVWAYCAVPKVRSKQQKMKFVGGQHLENPLPNLRLHGPFVGFTQVLVLRYSWASLGASLAPFKISQGARRDPE